MKVAIIIELDGGDENADPDHPMGITNDAYDRLTSFTEHGSPPLLWLGEVSDVEKVL
jgi:hypothetical protein